MKPEFTSTLVIQEYRPYEWLLFKPLQYWTMVNGKQELIEVEAGFRTDLASIPKLFRSLIPQNGRHRKPAVVHDYLYRRAGFHGWDRKTCDKIFLEGMIVEGVPRWRRQVMYRAVRAGGGLIWKENLKRNGWA